ncbi:MAG TPA: FecR family protein [Leptospiraceae bacterium]|nr:FecR family protein [Leptospiraceae bacterium]
MKGFLQDRSNLTIPVLLALVFVFSYMLCLNIRGAKGQGANPVIGTLTFKKKSIERKFDSDVAWDLVEQGITIHNRDTIRTGDFAEATLTLKDDTKININDNSMIYLDFSDSDINLNFAYGSMSLDKTSGAASENTLKIKTGDKTVEVKNSEVSLEKKDKDEVSLEIKKGDAKVIVGKEEKVIKTNESANIKEKEITVAKISIDLKSPAEGQIFSSRSDTADVGFDWNTQGDLKNARLEIAYDARFNKTVRILNIKSSEASVSLGGGSYYWRITGKNPDTRQTEFSQARKFSIVTIEKPIIFTPSSGQVFSYTSVSPLINIAWKKLENARTYRVEVSRTRDFVQTVRKEVTVQNYVNLDRLEDGVYHIRVAAESYLKGVSEEFSETRSFRIESKALPDPPILLQPVDSQKISKAAIDAGGYLFQWKDSPEFKNYAVQISSAPNFTSVVAELNPTSNFVKPAVKLKAGEYYWRVLGRTKDGRSSPYSQSASFQVRDSEKLELLSPSNKSAQSVNSDISFTWKKMEVPPNYILEISRDSDFRTKIFQESFRQYSASYVPKETGTYYWRVILVSEDRNELGKSDAFSFEVMDNKDPTAVYPKENETVDMANFDSLDFRWDMDKKAAYAVLELYQGGPGNETLIVRAKVKKMNYSFGDLTKLDEGNFYWSIQSFRETSTGVKESARVTVPFKIILSEKPTVPKIISSKKIYEDEDQ